MSRPHPGDEQTRHQVRAWMKEHARPGLIVVVRSTMQNWHFGGRYEYLLDEIEEVSPRKGRIYTHTPASHKAVGRGTYYFTGQSATDPTGQVDLLIPTPELVEAALSSDAQSGIGRGHHWTLVDRAIEQVETMYGAQLQRPEAPADGRRRETLEAIDGALRDAGFARQEVGPTEATLYRTERGQIAAIIETRPDHWQVFLPVSMTYRNWDELRERLDRYVNPPQPPMNLQAPTRGGGQSAATDAREA